MISLIILLLTISIVHLGGIYVILIKLVEGWGYYAWVLMNSPNLCHLL